MSVPVSRALVLPGMTVSETIRREPAGKSQAAHRTTFLGRLVMCGSCKADYGHLNDASCVRGLELGRNGRQRQDRAAISRGAISQPAVLCVAISLKGSPSPVLRFRVHGMALRSHSKGTVLCHRRRQAASLGAPAAGCPSLSGHEIMRAGELIQEYNVYEC
jgi:hypothetical protein